MTDGIKFKWHKAYGQSDVPSSVRSVAYVVWDYTDAQGNKGYPGIDRITASTGLSQRQALRNLADNVKRGWLGQVSSGARSGKAGIASEYRLTYPAGHRNSVSPVSPAPDIPVSRASPAEGNPVSSMTKPGVTSVTPTQPSTSAASGPIPDDWEPNKEHREQATRAGHNIDAVAAKFRSWAIERDIRLKSWDARFTAWIHVERAPKPQAGTTSGRSPSGRYWQE